MVSPTTRSALWAAWGDALGFPTELTRDGNDVQRRLATQRSEETQPWTRRIGGRMGPSVPLPAGTYSDDTQLRLAVGRCLRSAGRFDVEVFSKIELPIFLSYGLGVGRGTRAAAHALEKRGVRWYSNFFSDRTSRYVDGGGNGAAMRIQPHVWASASFKPESYLLNVVCDCVTTHGHPRALVGATLHALSLGATLGQGVVPEPARWRAMARYLQQLPELVQSDETLAQRWVPEWGRTAGEEWHVAFERAVSECEQLLRIAASSPPERSLAASYARVAEKIGGLDPATRGSGTVCAVLALWLALAGGKDAAGTLRVAANLLGSDTDTVASMVGALIGVAAMDEPEGALVNRDLIRDEALRLERMKTEPTTESFPHPDPLRWQPPRTLSDAVGLIDDRIAVAGLGPGKEESELYPSRGRDEASWQWLQLDYGQSVLVKRRRELTALPDYARPRVRPVLASPIQLRLAEPSGNVDLPEFVEDGVEFARSHAFAPEVVAQLLFHYAKQPHGVSKSSLFGGLIAQELARHASDDKR